MQRPPTSSAPFAFGLSIGAAIAVALLVAVYATGAVKIERDASDLSDRVRVFERVDASRSHWPTLRAGVTYDGLPTDWATEVGPRSLVYAADPQRPYAYRVQPSGSAIPEANATTPHATLDYTSNQRMMVRLEGPDGPARFSTFTDWLGFHVASTVRSGKRMRQPFTSFEPGWTAVTTSLGGQRSEPVPHRSTLDLTPARTYVFVPRPGVVAVLRSNGPASVELRDRDRDRADAEL
ncbi:MAG: hypothetical protein Q7T55_12010, partial [Solirubrobacteraceae bacterium]|nr:hypothetical protein [Solirubrobacteraceae bacterium]